LLVILHLTATCPTGITDACWRQAPAVDAAEALTAKYAADWPAWGHRKIATIMRDDGPASTSTVERALRRRGLLLPQGFRLIASPGRLAPPVH
jgi:hypothetical protein